MERRFLPVGYVSPLLLIANILFALFYLSWWFNPSHIGFLPLYALLFFGECYHVFMAIAFWTTIWPGKEKKLNKTLSRIPSIDIFVTVAGEPKELVARTIAAIKKMTGYPFQVYILNDGLVAKKENWQEMEDLAKETGVVCITRTTAGGAKAGNINHALSFTKGNVILIFDADMVPYPSFLQQVMPYFFDKKVAFVQTPQYYENFQESYVSQGAWEQQEFFYGPIMRGKSYRNSAFICGTNVALRRKALQEIGGMYEKSIAEDFLTSLFIHAKGWKSYYITEVLSQGLAPFTLQDYYKQQLRWAKGSIEVLFWKNPLFWKGLSWQQKLQYISSAAFYFNGLVVLIDSLMPIIFLFTGVHIVSAATTSFALYFVPFMFLNLYTLSLVSQSRLTFRAMSFAQSSFVLQLRAIFSTLFGVRMGFAITPKTKHDGNFLYLASPHLLYYALALAAAYVGFTRDGLSPSFVTNCAWILFNSVLLFPFIKASYAWDKLVLPFVKQTPMQTI